MMGLKPLWARAIAAAQPGGAGAYDHDLAAVADLGQTLDLRHEGLAAAARVHGAAALLARLGVDAVHAAQAVADEVLTPGGALADPVGVRDGRAAQGDQVAAAIHDNAVDIGRVLQVAARRNGDGHRRLDDLGQRHLPALGPVAVAAHALEPGEAAAGVHGYHGHADLLQFLGAGGQDLRGHAAGEDVGAVELRDYLDVGIAGLVQGAARLAYALAGETHGVLHVLLAVLVGPVVEVGAEELLAEVVVRIVPLDGVHAAGGAAQAGSDILALDVQYLVLGELVDYGDVLSALNGVGVGVGRAAGHPGLEGDLRAGGVHRRDRLLKLGYVLVVAKAGLGGHRAGPAEVYRHDAHGDHGHAALGHCFIIADIVLGGKSIFTQVTRHCRYDNPVLQDHFANADGL